MLQLNMKQQKEKIYFVCKWQPCFYLFRTMTQHIQEFGLLVSEGGILMIGLINRKFSRKL